MTEAFVPDWTMTDPNEYQYDFGGGAVFFQHQLDGKSSLDADPTCHASTSRDMSAEDKPPLLYAVKTPIATRRDAAFSLASS
jgi:hypothetical protein